MVNLIKMNSSNGKFTAIFILIGDVTYNDLIAKVQKKTGRRKSK